MKRYHRYVISWWKNGERFEKEFKLSQPARKFAAQLVEDYDTDFRHFYEYDNELNLIDEFTF